MKRAALVFGVLALAACSASAEDDADKLTAAVKKDVPAAEPTAESSDPYEPAKPPSETCATMRAKPARSEVTWTWTGPKAGSPPAKWADVEVYLRHFINEDGLHEYRMTLAMSSVKNGPLYTFGGHPMDEQVTQFSGRLVSNVREADPWRGVLAGNDNYVGAFTCRDGTYQGGGTSAFVDPSLQTYQDIEILKIEGGIVEGKFLRKTADLEVFAFGTFKGPITIDTDLTDETKTATGQPKKQGFAPNRALCCLLE